MCVECVRVRAVFDYYKRSFASTSVIMKQSITDTERMVILFCADAMLDTRPSEAHLELDEISTTDWTFIAMSSQYGTEEGEGKISGIQNARVKTGEGPGLPLPLGPSDTAAFFQVRNRLAMTSE